MSEKEKMQDSELNAVSGGGMNSERKSNATRCLRCNAWFVRTDVPFRNVKDGCNRYYVYQCPTCGDWLKTDGTVYRG